MVGYVRVSTEEQGVSGAGLETQREAITADCARHGRRLVAIFEDVASGKSLIRPGLDEARAVIAAGDASAIVVAKLDRLSRSVHDFSGLLAQAQREGWGLRILDPDVDTLSPTGELLAHITASVAQWERRVIGQRTAAALAVKRAQGVRLGRPPVVPADIAERIAERRRTGASLRTIAAELNADRVPTARPGSTWQASTLVRVLSRQGAPSVPRGPSTRRSAA